MRFVPSSPSLPASTEDGSSTERDTLRNLGSWKLQTYKTAGWARTTFHRMSSEGPRFAETGQMVYRCIL